MRANEKGKPVEILLVEDNPGDIRLATEALKTAKLDTNINVTMDGEDAMAYLHKEGKYVNAVEPDLILLDLNLPKLDGREVLGQIKNDPELKRIPVLVLTISQNDNDIRGCYTDHANCYITKPIDYNHFIQVVKSIEHFWLVIAQLPIDERASATIETGA